MLCINQIYDGGAERVLSYLTNHFAEKGYDTVLITSFPHSEEYYISKNVKRINLDAGHKYKSRIQKNVIRVSGIRGACMRYNPDVIISFMAASNVRCLFATIGLGVRNIISVRADPQLEYPGVLGKLTVNFLLSHADGCVFQTEKAKSWFPYILQKKSKVIGNPIGDDFYRVVRRPVTGRIVACGRLSPEKDYELLIEAFNSIHDEFSFTTLEIYGEGEQRHALIDIIHSLGISDHVTLHGQIKNVTDALALADVYVLTSKSEGMPNALLEAMAAGIPCIATDCTGVVEIIKDGYNGYIVPVGDKISLIGRLEYLFNNRSEMERLAKNAKEYADILSSDKIFKMWDEYISEICC